MQEKNETETLSDAKSAEKQQEEAQGHTVADTAAEMIAEHVHAANYHSWKHPR